MDKHGFKAISISMPTKEECQKTSAKWYDELRGTMLDELPKDIMKLSAETEFYEFDPELFGAGFDGDLTEVKRLSSLISKKHDWEQRVYKLCSRSPKDAWHNFGLTASSVQAFYWMICSERVCEDVCRFATLEERSPTIAVRHPVFSISGLGREEYRCFVKDGQLIAVTDYDYNLPNPRLQKADIRLRIRKSIDEFFVNRVGPAMHLKDYVFDLIQSCDNNGKWVLLEVNPYGLSDPCFLKSYDGVENFKGEIAFNYEDTHETIKEGK